MDKRQPRDKSWVASAPSAKRDPKTGLWTKSDRQSGRFQDVKASGGTFRGVKREN